MALYSLSLLFIDYKFTYLDLPYVIYANRGITVINGSKQEMKHSYNEEKTARFKLI